MIEKRIFKVWGRNIMHACKLSPQHLARKFDFILKFWKLTYFFDDYKRNITPIQCITNRTHGRQKQTYLLPLIALSESLVTWPWWKNVKERLSPEQLGSRGRCKPPGGVQGRSPWKLSDFKLTITATRAILTWFFTQKHQQIGQKNVDSKK